MIYKSHIFMFFCLTQIVCGSQNPPIPTASSWDMCSADSPHHLIKHDTYVSSCDESSKKTSGASLPELEETSATQPEAPTVVNVVIGPLPTEDFIKNTVEVDFKEEETESEKTELTRKPNITPFLRSAQAGQPLHINPILFPYRPDSLVYAIPGIPKAQPEPEPDWLQKAKNALGNFFSVSSTESIDGEELGNDNV